MTAPAMPATAREKLVELKPCPFCGKPPRVCPDTSYGAAVVYCPDDNRCGVAPSADADLTVEGIEHAIERWNTRTEAADALAALDAGWRDITTAPRDPDSCILVYWPSALQGKGTICTAIWSDTRCEFSPWPSPMRGVKFTHWMPLPSSPVEQGE